MCNTGLILKIREEERAKKSIEQALAQKREENMDGFGILTIDGNRDIVLNLTRTMDIAKAQKASELEHDLLFYHYRIATSGNIDKSGIHFWRRGQFYFAHNGFAYQQNNYSNTLGFDPYYNKANGGMGRKNVRIAKHQKGDTGDVDSQVFFYRFIEKLREKNDTRPKAILQVARKMDKDISGRYQLIDAKKRRAYFIGDWFTYVVNNSYIIVTSARMDFSQKLTIVGLPFDGSSKLRVIKGKIDGVWLLSIQSRRFRKVGDIDEGLASYYDTEKGYYRV